MRRSAFWWMSSTLTGVVLFLAGCQFPGFRSVQRENPDRHERPLSNSQVADVQLTLARSLEQRGELEPALNAYEQAVAKDPKRATGYWRMAVLHDQLGNVEESEALYQQALKLEAKNPDLLCDYGYSLYLRRRWAESEEQLRQVLILKPKHARAHNNLGLVLAQTERAPEALAEFRQAGCDTAAAHTNLAFIMTLNRQWDRAREHYELALDANPDFAAAKTGLESLEAVVVKAAGAPGTVELTHHERPSGSRGSSAVRETTPEASVPSGETSEPVTMSLTDLEY